MQSDKEAAAAIQAAVRPLQSDKEEATAIQATVRIRQEPSMAEVLPMANDFLYNYCNK